MGKLQIPRIYLSLQKTLPRFRAWLVERGSEIRAPTNEWEVLRFLAPEGIAIVYRRQDNTLTWTGPAKAAYEAFLHQKPWRAMDRAPRQRLKASQHRRHVIDLMARDGDTCAYCGQPLNHDTATIEHFVALTSGGPNHMANKMLACVDCNSTASHLSVREKLELAILKRNQIGT